METVLLQIDEELESSEVAALKFLCSDHVTRKPLERVTDGLSLFLCLKEQNLLEDRLFLSELLLTIHRNDLLSSHLETDSQKVERSLDNRLDRSGLSSYRKMLYELSEDVTQENLSKMKFLLKIPKGKQELCKTFLDVLSEMEKQEILAEDRLEELEKVLHQCDKQLASRVEQFRKQHRSGRDSSRCSFPDKRISPSRSCFDQPCFSPAPPLQSLSISESQPSGRYMIDEQSVMSDAVGNPLSDQEDCYPMMHSCHGICLIINNYNFRRVGLGDRAGTEKDEEELIKVFSWLGFNVEVRNDLTAGAMLQVLEEQGEQNHTSMDAFVCCILSHGEKAVVLGTDGFPVPLTDLTQPFDGLHCPSLAGKPKLFFIQACQGEEMQRAAPLPRTAAQDGHYEADAAHTDTIPIGADFLIGMATVEDCKSFRNTKQGSIYIQELCKQLRQGCQRGDDLLEILTRVNRAVSAGVYRKHKQMPEPRYTLTRKVVLQPNLR